jgi:hypothetical protein
MGIVYVITTYVTPKTEATGQNVSHFFWGWGGGGRVGYVNAAAWACIIQS